MGGGRQEGGGMGMMNRMMGNMGGMSGQVGGAQADLKKQMKTLTRTDFLIQFVWKPLTEEERPKNDEERAEKLKKIVALLTEAEKNNPAIKVSKEDMEKELNAVSLKKSEQLESKIGAIGAGTAVPGAAVPGAVPPAGNPPGAAVPGPVAK
jgi:type IV pilus assembly protein PilM